MEKKLCIVHIAYVTNNNVTDPDAWLKQINFFTVVLKSMTTDGKVFNFDFIGFTGTLLRKGVTHCFKQSTKIQLLFPVITHLKIKKLKPDAIIVHGLNKPWQIVLLRWQVGSKVKIILQHHAERPLQDIRQYFQRWADRCIDAYLFTSKDLASRWVAVGQIKDQNKIKEVMEVSSLFYPIDRNSARAKTRIDDQKTFLWIGRLLPIKNPLLTVQAFARFAELNPGVKLYMIYQSIELLNEVKAIIKNMKMQDSIVLVGKVEHDELLNWYNSVDYIISSSLYEGSGTAVCEAMSCGCVPILSSIPSFEMMTDRGRIGLLFETGNENALLSALQKSLTLNLEAERRNVLNQFETKLSPGAIAREIYQVIASL